MTDESIEGRWKAFQGHALGMLPIVACIALVAMAVAGRIVVPTLEPVKSWFGNFTNGFIGAAFGSGVAIWWAASERNRIEKRKRQAISTALYAEVMDSWLYAQLLMDSAKLPVVFADHISRDIEAHVELIPAPLYLLIREYRDAMRDVHERLALFRSNSTAPVRGASSLYFFPRMAETKDVTNAASRLLRESNKLRVALEESGDVVAKTPL